MQKESNKNESTMMSHLDNNWQFSEVMMKEGYRRIYIKNYQSSPIELLVSAVNERLKKNQTAKDKALTAAPQTNQKALTSGQQKVQAKQIPSQQQDQDELEEIQNKAMLVKNGLIELDEDTEEQALDNEVVGLIGSRDE